MPVRAVLLDFGHTLVDFVRTEEALRAAYEQIRDRVEAVGYMEMPEILDLIERVVTGIEEQVAESYRERRMEELDLLTVFEEGLASVGFSLPPDVVQHVVALYHSSFSNSLEAKPETIEALEALKADGYRLGLVSNVTLLPDLMRRDLESLGLARFFDATTFSSEVGVRKPDPRIFTHALDALEVPAAETVFVGDRLHDDVSGAHGVGMRAVLTKEFRAEEDPDIEPDAVIERLGELPEVVARWKDAR